MLNTNFTSFPILRTERLKLRQLRAEDEQEVFNLRSDTDINKYLDRQPCHTILDARDFINKVNENIDKKLSLYWAITRNNRGDTLIGTICLYDFSIDNCNCEIGYELSTDCQGQGLMIEAAEKVIAYAFHTLKMKKIEACLHRENQRSIKLLEQLSFNRSNKIDVAGSTMISYERTS